MKAVLFDLDGTLIDTAADFVRIIQNMCRTAGREIVAADLIRTQVSEGARAMVQLVYPELDSQDPVFLQHRQRFLDLYAAEIAVDTDLFADMPALLEQLEANQIPWGIVTNKPRWLSEALLKALALEQRCAVLVCPEDVSRPSLILSRCILPQIKSISRHQRLFMLVIIHVILMREEMLVCIRF